MVLGLARRVASPPMAAKFATTVRIDGARIIDEASFHAVFAKAMGFPSFYGKNMNAWVDCMTCVDDPTAGMSRVVVAPGAVLTLIVDDASAMKARCPDVHEALLECAAFVNWRRIEGGGKAVLALALFA